MNEYIIIIYNTQIWNVDNEVFFRFITIYESSVRFL